MSEMALAALIIIPVFWAMNAYTRSEARDSLRKIREMRAEVYRRQHHREPPTEWWNEPH